MKKFDFIFKCVLIGLLINNTIAQEKSSAAVSSDKSILLDAKIKHKILNTNTGIVLVHTKKSTYGLSPETQSIIWQNTALKKLDFSSYNEIPFTPYILFDSKPLLYSKLLSNTLGTRGISRTIVDVGTGKVMFNSKKEGFKAVVITLLLPEQNALLVDGIKKDQFVISLYDYETGDPVWENDFEKSGLFDNARASRKKQHTMLDADQNIFWLRNQFLLKIDGKTGNLLYEFDDVEDFALSNDRKKIFIFSNDVELEKAKEKTSVMAYDVQLMRPIWAKPAIIIGNIRETAIDQGKLIAITAKGFQSMDINTGEKQFSEPESLPLIK